MAELIWDGKYDEHGNKRAPVRIELPFQTVETVNESAQERQRTLELSSSGNDPEWRNRLIWGDKKYVLPSLLPEFAGKVDLIYIDPPFDTGADFSFTAAIPEHHGGSDGEQTFSKQPSILEQKAYRDTWGSGLESYLKWFYETALLLRELLTEGGSLYVHLDWHIGHHAKAVLDEVLGTEAFDSEIIWKSTSAHANNRTYGNIHQTILFYVKAGRPSYFDTQFVPYDPEYVDQYYRYKDPDGRRFMSGDLVGHTGVNPAYEWRGITRPWRFPKHRLEELDGAGKIFWTKNDFPRLKRYLDEAKGMPAQSIWADKEAQYVVSWSTEGLGYATQKPEALLDRIIKASSKKDALVLDCFCGSGTTAAVAEKLNRRWIACDLGRFAIHTTRKRLLGISNVKPFVVQNLGKYERQAWQLAEFAPSISLSSRAEQDRSLASDSAQSRDLLSSEAETRSAKSRSLHSARASASGTSGSGRDDSGLSDDRLREQRQRESAYRKFILELYHATPVSGHVWLHGVKSGRMVHVGAVDAPVTRADVNAIAAEVWKSKSAERPAVDILGWEFALELNETAKEVAAQARVDAAFKKIPREVLEKKAVEQGDVYFFELGALSVDIKIKKRELTLKLSDFVIPLDDVPEEVRGAIKHWSQMVDYWAVDWDFKDDTFHNQWQSYRTRKDPKLELSKEHEYAEPGKYMVVVKVIDILGNDTTKTLEVEVK
jgi:adenine-specific DNA-methyltransferase